MWSFLFLQVAMSDLYYALLLEDLEADEFINATNAVSFKHIRKVFSSHETEKVTEIPFFLVSNFYFSKIERK